MILDIHKIKKIFEIFYIDTWRDKIMNPTIRVDIEELMNLLQSMLDEGYTVTELELDDSTYYDESTLNLKAIDVSSSDNVDYGSVSSVPEDF